MTYKKAYVYPINSQGKVHVPLNGIQGNHIFLDLSHMWISLFDTKSTLIEKLKVHNI